MTEGFSQDALAFVVGEASTAPTAPAIPNRAVTLSRKRTSPATKRPAPSGTNAAPAPDSTVSMTFRLPADLPCRLIQISAERKVRREVPCSQQDIVAEALREWLTTHAS